jgi:ATP-binding cassette subfamily F protein uup
MNYLSVENISKRFGDKELFSNISFGLSKGDKSALIARNGTGKTSLLRILANLEQPDSGNIAFRNNIRIGYLEQDPDFTGSLTISDYIFNVSDPVQLAIKDYEVAIESGDMDIISKAYAQMDALQAWDHESRAQQVLSKLGIDHLTQSFETLSGGQKKRIALSKILIDEPDLLILDEPTNHLDVDMIEWLEAWLSRQNVTLLLVTHDRYFLDRICTRIIEMDRGKIFTYEGNYEYFIEKKAEREMTEGAEISKAKNTYRSELEWVRRMPKARGTKSKSRLDQFEDIKEVAFRKTDNKDLTFNIKMSRIGGKILELKNIQKKYGEKVIIKSFDHTFKHGERIGIIGKNGIGKSTFLNIITGKEQADSGKINTGETIVFGYFTQESFSMHDDKRVIDVIKDIADIIPTAKGGHITASQLLTAFHFQPDTQYNKVGKLSGGEKRRLQLVRILMSNPNFLILDEPTNDLDILTLNALEEFLMSFTGCLLVVSHDRYFMDKLVEHLFVFEGEGVINMFNGTYNEYRDQKRLEEKNSSSNNASKPIEKPIAKVVEVNTDKRKLSFKEKHEFEQLAIQIEQLNKNKSTLEKNLSSGSDNHEDIIKWAAEIKEIQNVLDEKELRWLELSDLAE